MGDDLAPRERQASVSILVERHGGKCSLDTLSLEGSRHMAASALGASIVAARETHQRGERELKRLREAARNAKKRARTLKDELKSARKSAKQARKKLRKAIAAHERATLLLNQARAGAAHSGAALGVAKAAQPKAAPKPAQPKAAKKAAQPKVGQKPAQPKAAKKAAQPKVAQKPAPRKKRPIQRDKAKTTRKSQRRRPEVVAPEVATTATDANAAALGSVETVLPTAESAVE